MRAGGGGFLRHVRRSQGGKPRKLTLMVSANNELTRAWYFGDMLGSRFSVEVDIAFIRTHLSRGFRSCAWIAVHAGARSCEPRRVEDLRDLADRRADTWHGAGEEPPRRAAPRIDWAHPNSRVAPCLKFQSAKRPGNPNFRWRLVWIANTDLIIDRLGQPNPRVISRSDTWRR
jgi:hypothetical protein